MLPRQGFHHQHRVNVRRHCEPWSWQAHYNASKAGVIHLSKSMAMEWLAAVSASIPISPGYTATPMNAS